MPDEGTETTAATQETQTQQTAAQDERKFTQKDLDGVVHKRLQQEREQAAAKYGDYDTIKAQLAEYQGANDEAKTTLATITGERDELKSTAEATRLENTRLRVWP